jgi:hypothetical protein
MALSDRHRAAYPAGHLFCCATKLIKIWLQIKRIRVFIALLPTHISKVGVEIKTSKISFYN